MDLYLDKKRVRVGDADLLGEGGEARVFRHKDLALKVFHAIDAAKVKKLQRFPLRKRTPTRKSTSKITCGRWCSSKMAAAAVWG